MIITSKKDISKTEHMEIKFTLDEIEKLADICCFRVCETPYGSKDFNNAIDFTAIFSKILKQNKFRYIEVEFTLDEIKNLVDICYFGITDAPYGSETSKNAIDFCTSFYTIVEELKHGNI